MTLTDRCPVAYCWNAKPFVQVCCDEHLAQVHPDDLCALRRARRGHDPMLAVSIRRRIIDTLNTAHAV